MYKIQIDIMEPGHERRVLWNNTTLLLQAVLDGTKIVKQRLGMDDIDFLPLNAYEYIIWGHGRCCGLLSVYEPTSIETN